MQRLPPTHLLHRSDEVLATGTKDTRTHATGRQILRTAARPPAQDWGELNCQEAMDQNKRNSHREHGLTIYPTPDGTRLWAPRPHRFVPPTVMLPEEP